MCKIFGILFGEVRFDPLVLVEEQPLNERGCLSQRLRPLEERDTTPAMRKQNQVAIGIRTQLKKYFCRVELN